MQNWKLIQDSTEKGTFGRDSGYSGQLISDSGFANQVTPKLTFNFTLEVYFRNPMLQNSLVWGHENLEMITIPLKTATRPTTNVTYTDVNYYNYRTKVATRTEYGPVSVSMYDDGANVVHDFYKHYMETISPIAKNGDSMELADSPFATPFSGASSLAPLVHGSGLIRFMKVNHFHRVANVWLKTVYTYVNPKIQSFNLDELDMTKSDVNTVTMEFVPDAVTVKTETSEQYTPKVKIGV